MSLLLSLVGCWIGEFGLELRLDNDIDDVVLGIDCDDDNDQIQTLDDVSLTATLTCGSVELLTLGSGRCNDEGYSFDDLERPGTAPLAVMPCSDPLDHDRFLPTLYHDEVVLVTVPQATEVRVVATTTDCLAVEPEPYPLDLLYPVGTFLVANQGPVCGPERCVVGMPLWNENSLTDVYQAGDELEASVSFFALPGERWFVVASAGSGTAQVSVTCPGIDGASP